MHCCVNTLFMFKTFTLRSYYCNLTAVTSVSRCVWHDVAFVTAVKNSLLNTPRPGGIEVVVGFTLCIFRIGELSCLKCSDSVVFMTNLLVRKIWQSDSIRVSQNMSTAHITWKIDLHSFERNALSSYGPTNMVKKIWVAYGRQCFYYFTKNSH